MLVFSESWNYFLFAERVVVFTAKKAHYTELLHVVELCEWGVVTHRVRSLSF